MIVARLGIRDVISTAGPWQRVVRVWTSVLLTQSLIASVHGEYGKLGEKHLPWRKLIPDASQWLRSSFSSLVFPMPASPFRKTRRPLPLAEESTRDFRTASSFSLPINGKNYYSKFRAEKCPA